MNATQPSGTATCVVRAMTDADIPAAIALWGEAEGVELGEGDSPAEIAAYLNRNTGVSQVAVADDRLVAAVLAGHDARRGYLYHLAVASSHRGRGLGRALVVRTLDLLRREGVRRVLILVARDNAGGRAFWVRGGWEPLAGAEPLGIDL